MEGFGTPLPAALAGLGRDGLRDRTDPVPGLVGFTAALRHAGLPVTTDRVAAFLTALDELDVTSKPQTYVFCKACCLS